MYHDIRYTFFFFFFNNLLYVKTCTFRYGLIWSAYIYYSITIIINIIFMLLEIPVYIKKKMKITLQDIIYNTCRYIRCLYKKIQPDALQSELHTQTRCTQQLLSDLHVRFERLRTISTTLVCKVCSQQRHREFMTSSHSDMYFVYGCSRCKFFCLPTRTTKKAGCLG